MLKIHSIFLAALFVSTSLMAQTATPQEEEAVDVIEYDDGSYDAASQLEFAGGPLILNLNDCIRLALANNGKIQGKMSGIEAAGWQKKEAKGYWKPRLEYEYQGAVVPADISDAFNAYFNADWSFFSRGKLTLGVPVYSFGQFKLAEKLADQGVQKSIQDKYKDEAEVASQVRQLFSGILLSKELHDLLDNARDELERRIEKEEANPEHSPFQTMQMQMVLLEVEKRLAEINDRGNLAKAGMRVQLGLPPDADFGLTQDKLRPVRATLGSLEDYLKVAGDYRPESQMLAIGVQAKQLEYQLEKRKMMPGLGLGGFVEIGRTTSDIRGVSASNVDPFNFTRGGLGIEMRGKFDFYGSHTRIKRLEAEYHKTLLDVSIAKRAIGLDVQEAYQNAKRAQDNLMRADETQSLARRMMFVTKSNIDIGLGSEKEYVEALKQLVESRGDYFKTVFDFNVALAKLDEKIGVVPEVQGGTP